MTTETKAFLKVALHKARKDIENHKGVNMNLLQEIEKVRDSNQKLAKQQRTEAKRTKAMATSWGQLKNAETALKRSVELQKATEQSGVAIAISRDAAVKELNDMRERFAGIAKSRDAQAELIRNNAFTMDTMLTDLKQARQTTNTLANALQRILDLT